MNVLHGAARRTLAVSAWMGLAASLSAVTPVQAAKITVTVSGFAFSPAQVRAKVGDTVEWVNKDFFTHTATARSGAFDVQLPGGGSGRTVVRAAGTFDYYCTHHGNMVGQLVVTK